MKIFKLFRYLLWPWVLVISTWVLYQLPLANIKLSIAALSWQDWFAWILLNSLIIYLGSLRWWLLLNLLQVHVHLRSLICIRQAGQAISFISPGPQVGGEPLQLFWLNKCGVSWQKAFLSLGLDRFFELFINLSVLLLSVLVILISPNGSLFIGHKIVFVFIVPLITVIAVSLFLVRQPKWFLNFFKRWRMPWAEHPRLLSVKNHWQSLRFDLHHLFKTKKLKLSLAVILSIASWVGLIGELALLLRFVDVSLGYTEFALLLVAIRLALLLPIPGGLGTLEASVIWSFQQLSLPISAALCLIALMRLRDAAILIAGLVCLRQVGGKPKQQLLSA